MGCGGSKKEKSSDVTLVHDAADAYAMAEADKIMQDGKEQLKGMGGGIMQEGQREAILEQIFEATDDDNSGAVSMNEYTQLFDSKLDDEMRSKFHEIDSDPDAKLTKEEFISWHLKKFEKLEDDIFLIVTGRLLARAEEIEVIDDTPAVVEGQ